MNNSVHNYGLRVFPFHLKVLVSNIDNIDDNRCTTPFRMIGDKDTDTKKECNSKANEVIVTSYRIKCNQYTNPACASASAVTGNFPVSRRPSPSLQMHKGSKNNKIIWGKER
ncbi:hypothetical protein HELRODRAFT_176006 [Helobdella robusta]|uniref:Uncharacterized protein n=1 Tax=Helobdella robusta TaxID=6412 RepID=T1FA07_HELRO|nr:hypothetical protein HELRODRAFT_176006 [Helobdella robusta]ESO00178.1 hypothetical protein HELRODRAFT_176006 [Helobdella robusta]